MNYGFFMASAMGAVAPPPVSDAWYDLVFSGSDAGMAFDFNDLSSVYQDTGGTTVVTTAGDPIASVRCQITGALAVLQGAYTSTLGYDATYGKYYASVGTTTTGTTPLFRATGTLPSDFLGDTPFSLVAVADWNSSQQSLFAHFGDPVAGSGNSGTLGHLLDPGMKLDFIQWGSGRGTQSAAISGIKTAIGTKGPRVSGTAPSAIYVDGVAQVTNGLMNGSPANVVTKNFDIGRITPSGRRIYTVGVIDRALTALEAAAVHAAALPS